MKHFDVLVLLISSAFVACMTFEIEGERSDLEKSFWKVLQRLIKDVEILKAENRRLKDDSPEVLKKEITRLQGDNRNLKNQLARLRSEVNHLNNNGHAQFSVSDQQWQALHMAAAAACRGSTPKGGHGPWFNAVYPRTTGHTCTEVCKATKYFTKCDASLSIMGYMGRVRSANQPAGKFYNYHCKRHGFRAVKHEETTTDSYIYTAGNYMGYCCCRKP